MTPRTVIRCRRGLPRKSQLQLQTAAGMLLQFGGQATREALFFHIWAAAVLSAQPLPFGRCSFLSARRRSCGQAAAGEQRGWRRFPGKMEAKGLAVRDSLLLRQLGLGGGTWGVIQGGMAVMGALDILVDEAAIPTDCHCRCHYHSTVPFICRVDEAAPRTSCRAPVGSMATCAALVAWDDALGSYVASLAAAGAKGRHMALA